MGTKYLVIGIDAGFHFQSDLEAYFGEGYQFTSLAQLRRDVEAKAAEIGAVLGGFSQEMFECHGETEWYFDFSQYIYYEVPADYNGQAWYFLDGENYESTLAETGENTYAKFFKAPKGVWMGRYAWDEEGEDIYLAEGE